MQAECLELAQQFDVHAIRSRDGSVSCWGGASGVFGGIGTDKADDGPDFKTLHAQIGQLALENNF